MTRTIRILITLLVALGLAGMHESALPTYASGATVTDCPTTETALNTDIGKAGAGGTVTFTCTSATTIPFDSARGGTGVITIGQDLTLDGSNSAPVTFDGGGSTQLFSVSGGSTLNLNGLTLSHGYVFSDSGGAISNAGTVTITNSTLSSNSAGNGAAISNAGTVTITNSTLTGNSTSGFGGAIYSDSTATITDSTISGNAAAFGGGAIYNDGTASMTRSIVSDNTASFHGNGNCYGNGVSDNGYNVESGNDCGFTGTGSLQNTDPKLLALANNGGPTQTMALAYDSPAMGRIPSALCPATDQRGYTRPDSDEANCDSGAYEYQLTTVTDCPTTETALNTDIGTAGGGGTVAFNCTSPTTIPFDSARGGTGVITIGQDLTLDGSNSAPVTFDGGGSTQLFSVSGALSLKGLILSHGHIATGFQEGGAIDNSGTVSITSSTLSGNYALYEGGAIYNSGAGRLSITNSTLSGNSTDNYGGALSNYGTLDITNSTLSGNSAVYYGGAIYVAAGTVNVTNSTLSGNSAPYGGAAINNDDVFGGDLLLIRGSIIAKGTSGGNCLGNGIIDSGYNLEDGTDCGFTGTGSLQNANPTLSTLANHGGPTATVALLSDSPAIDAIPTSTGFCPATDQRGFARLDGSESNCDIGAYEYREPITDCPATEAALDHDIGNADTVTFNCTNPTTIYFDSGHTGGTGTPIAISKEVTLDGRSSAPVTLDGGGSTRLLSISDTGSLTLKGLTLSHGHADVGTGGGAISNAGTLTITNSTLSNNAAGAVNTGDEGGAIFNTGTLIIATSTLSGNTSGSGGAIDNEGGLTITNSTLADNYGNRNGGAILGATRQTVTTITNSTLSGNSTGIAGDGGAIYNFGKLTVTNSTLSGNSARDLGGAIYNFGTTTITSGTVSGNSAPGGGAIYGVARFGGTVTVGDSIIARGASGGNCAGTTIIDSGYNLEDGTDCGFTATGSLQNANPTLGTLGNNGGPTQTVALLSGSPAIDAIPSAHCSATDQRGIARLDGSESSCDIGAYEYQEPTTQSQTINFTSAAPTGAVYGDTYAPTATASSGLTVTFGASGACSYDSSSGHVTMTGVGNCMVTADQSGDGTHLAAPQKTQSFSVGKKPLTVTASHAAIVYGDAVPSSFTIDYNGWVGSDSASGGAISGSPTCSTTYTNTSPPSGYPISCTLGSLASTNYTPADGSGTALSADGSPGLTLGTLTVDRARQAPLSFTAPGSGTYGQTYSLGTTGGSGNGAVSYDTGTSLACSVADNQLTITSGTGTCTVTATKAGDADYLSTTSTAATVAVTKASQTITLTAPTGVTYGDADSDPGAHASSGLPVSYASSTASVCAIVAGRLHVVAAGSCTVTASQGGNDNYNAASDVSRTFSIARAASSVTVTSSVAQSIVGQSVTFTATVSSTAGNPTGTVTFRDGTGTLGTGAVNGSGIATYITSTLVIGTRSITASYAGDTNFNVKVSTPVSQQVRYGVKTLSTATLTIVLQLQNFTLANLSASTVPVTAQCVVASSATPPTSCTPSVLTITKAFGFLNNFKSQGPAYSFSINPKGLTKGQKYYLLVQTGSDPILHAVQFTA